ncbi:GNAT family N-acetyltransferase [Gammaproteobacteria bacterium]|nr:GNAT family N-acetyltransferase [Gammaproteobacteria bacterium]
MTLPKIILENGYYLRALKISDAKQYMNLLQHPSIRPFIPDRNVPSNFIESVGKIHTLAKLYSMNQGAVWAICRPDDQLIGSIGFDVYDSRHRRLDIAFEIHPDYQRKGIIFSAMPSVLAFGFEQLKAIRIQALTFVDNHPSMQLLKKSGFTQEGILRQYQIFNSKVIDVVIFGITP